MTIRSIEALPTQIGNRTHTFVRIATDEDLVGWGEAYSAGPDEAVAACIQDFARWLIGRDATAIEGAWRLMYNGSRFPPGIIVGAAISGIDQALWDIKGKALGVPVYQLLGGACRDKVRVYQSPRGDSAEALAASARELIDRYGYGALKLGPHDPGYASQSQGELVRTAATRVEAVRREVGDDIDLGVDIHARTFEPAFALEMIDAMAASRPFFVEEPIRPEHTAALAGLRAKSRVPIATGECLFHKAQFRDLFVATGTDIVQPDLCLIGGISEMVRIAALAESFSVPVAPHNPMGPVATAANAHVAMATHAILILEYIPDDTGPRRDAVMEPFALEDGYLQVPDRPGLGIEVNEEAVRAGSARPWHRAFPIRADGSTGYQ